MIECVLHTVGEAGNYGLTQCQSQGDVSDRYVVKVTAIFIKEQLRKKEFNIIKKIQFWIELDIMNVTNVTS